MVTEGYFHNVPGGRIAEINGEMAQVTFDLLDQRRGPVPIPVAHLRRLESDDSSKDTVGGGMESSL